MVWLDLMQKLRVPDNDWGPWTKEGIPKYVTNEGGFFGYDG